MDVLDLHVAYKETILIIGRVPNFIDSSILRQNLLERFKSVSSLLSIKIEDDKDSICEEKIAKLTYEDDCKQERLKELSGKIFSFSTEEFHGMINIVSSDSKCLDKMAKDILKNQSFDLVMAYPNKPVLGFNISILGSNDLIKNNKPKLKDRLFSTIKASSVIISRQYLGKAYGILHFVEQDDLLEASQILCEKGIVFGDQSYELETINDSICRFKIID